jgi:hypothetical protein
LPDILFEQWAQKEFGKEEAVDMKAKYFQNIYVMGKDAVGAVRLKVLRLSSEFIIQARERLRQEQKEGSP